MAATGERTIREAVGVFPDAHALEAAIDELFASGFDQAEISVLATREAMEHKLGDRFASIRELEDDPHAPRATYVTQESVGAGEGSLVGGLAYLPAVTAAGVVVASGGTLGPAIAAAIGFGGAGAVIGGVLARWLGQQHGRQLQHQMERGGILLWVRTRDREHEERALEVLRRNGGQDVHAHDVPAPTGVRAPLG